MRPRVGRLQRPGAENVDAHAGTRTCPSPPHAQGNGHQHVDANERTTARRTRSMGGREGSAVPRPRESRRVPLRHRFSRDDHTLRRCAARRRERAARPAQASLHLDPAQHRRVVWQDERPRRGPLPVHRTRLGPRNAAPSSTSPSRRACSTRPRSATPKTLLARVVAMLTNAHLRSRSRVRVPFALACDGLGLVSGSCPFQRERPRERSSGDYPRRQLQPI
jgi:hypothetical protein